MQYMEPNQLADQRSRKRELADKLATLLLGIIGIIGFLIALASLFDPIYKYILTAVPALGLINFTALILLIFSILAIAVGLERYATLDDARQEKQRGHEEVIRAIKQVQQVAEQHDLHLEKEIDDIQRTLISSVEAKVLFGPEAVYSEAMKLIRTCEGSEIIRATSLDQFTTLDSYANLENMSSYRSYIETLAKTVGQKKHNKIGMAYKVVVAFRSDEKGELLPSHKQILDKRRELFKKYGALDKLEIKWLDSYWSLDLMIIGNKQIIILFPTVVGDHHHRLAIRITHEGFVTSVSRWYDERPWREAKDLLWEDQEAL